MKPLFLLIFLSLPLAAQDEIPHSCQELLQLAERLDQLQRQKERPSDGEEALAHREFTELTDQFIEQISDFGDERLQQWCEENRRNYQAIIDQQGTFGRLKRWLLR